MKQNVFTDFNSWWNEIGSRIRNQSSHDYEEHAKQIALVAWMTGSKCEREACAKLVEELSSNKLWDFAQAIRARGEVK